MARHLFIVGASARACAESAARAGYDPVSFDLFADMDLRATGPATRLDGGYGDLDKVFPSGAEPWMYAGGLENHPRLVDRLALRRPLWGMEGQPLRRARRPWHWCALLRDAGLPVPGWGMAGGPSLLKPLAGAGGKGIRRWHGGISHTPWREFRQEWRDGEPVAALYCGLPDRVELLGVTRQLIGGPGGLFCYRGSIGPIDPGPEISNIRLIGEALGMRLGLKGLFGVDGILGESGFTPVEINPRYTASAEVIEKATGVPVVAWQAAVFGAGPVPPMKPYARVVAKEIIYATREIQAPVGLDALGGLSDIPLPGTRIPAGGPILTANADGPTEREARAKLELKVDAFNSFIAKALGGY